MEKIKKLYEKYREIIVYLVVGVLTTIVSWTVVFIGKLFMDMDVSWQNFLNNSLSWAAGVCFAYPLNRKWVFKSSNPKIFKEFIEFATSRISTWILDVVIMWMFVNLFTLKSLIAWVCSWFSYTFTDEQLTNMNYWVAKIVISSVLVTVANYVFSKFLIFNKKEKEKK